MPLSFLEKGSSLNIVELGTPALEQSTELWGTRFVTPKDWVDMKSFLEVVHIWPNHSARNLMQVVSQATSYTFNPNLPSLKEMEDKIITFKSKTPSTSPDVFASNVKEALGQLITLRQFFGDQFDQLDQVAIATVERRALEEMQRMEYTNNIDSFINFATEFRVAFPDRDPDSYITTEKYQQFTEFKSKLAGAKLVVFLRNLRILYPTKTQQMVNEQFFQKQARVKRIFRKNKNIQRLLEQSEAEIILSAPWLEVGTHGIIVVDDSNRSGTRLHGEPPTQRSF